MRFVMLQAGNRCETIAPPNSGVPMPSSTSSNTCCTTASTGSWQTATRPPPPTTLIRFRPHRRPARTGDNPCELTGYGPIPARHGPPHRRRRRLASACSPDPTDGAVPRRAPHHPPRPRRPVAEKPCPRPPPRLRLAQGAATAPPANATGTTQPPSHKPAERRWPGSLPYCRLPPRSMKDTPAWGWSQQRPPRNGSVTLIAPTGPPLHNSPSPPPPPTSHRSRDTRTLHRSNASNGSERTPLLLSRPLETCLPLNAHWTRAPAMANRCA